MSTQLTAATDDGSQFHADAKNCTGMKGFTDTVEF